MTDALTQNQTHNNKIDSKIQFGMSSFNQQREQFGRSVSLAMSCIDGLSSKPVKGPVIASNEKDRLKQLKALSQEITSQHADLLELLLRFDDIKGWKNTGAKHCAAWMNAEIGISLKLSWEYLRVGRQLQSLPLLKTLFRVGKLSWSKVRLISRVADEDNEALLCHAAMDASVTDVKQFCQDYQWNEDESGATNDPKENQLALEQWNSRSLT